MLTLKVISQETEKVLKGLEKKHFKNAKETIEKVLELDKVRRAAQQELDNVLAQNKQLAAKVGQLMKAQAVEEANAVKAEVAVLKDKAKELQEKMDAAAEELQQVLYTIPNIPYDEVPEGAVAEDNVVEKTGGTETVLPENALPHWELAKKYDLIDFDLGVKITGAGFPVYKGKELDNVLAQNKQLAAKVGQLMKAQAVEEANAVKAEVAVLKDKAKELQEKMDAAAEELQQVLYTIPNIPYDEVPEGAVAEDNVVEKTGGTETVLPENALPHWELAKKYDLIDFDLGVKITGAGFPVYKGKGAQLQRALINFFLDEARKAGYVEIMPPTVVNAASGYGTGQLPDKEGQMYHCDLDDLYLIPTAEVPVTNIYRDVILDEKQLPIKNCAYTQCFRREAGSYGKDVRGLNRLHEFSKVEIVRIDTPEHSKESHKEMLEHVEGLLKKLELPYRILRLCGGDMSFTAALCFDFEVYSEAQQRWLEVSSVSNFDSYQANRLKCRYRNADKKTELCHTLNGSALALPRIVAALLENNQTPEGIRIPKALVPYCGFEIID